MNSTPASVSETDPRLPAPGFAVQILQSNNGTAWQAVNASALTASNNGQVLKYTHGSGWAASADNSTDSRLPGSVGASGTVLTSNGSSWTSVAPNLPSTSCNSANQFIQWNGSVWSCGTSAAGSSGNGSVGQLASLFASTHRITPPTNPGYWPSYIYCPTATANLNWMFTLLGFNTTTGSQVAVYGASGVTSTISFNTSGTITASSTNVNPCHTTGGTLANICAANRCSAN